jgi:hypothetical protein
MSNGMPQTFNILTTSQNSGAPFRMLMRREIPRLCLP